MITLVLHFILLHLIMCSTIITPSLVEIVLNYNISGWIFLKGLDSDTLKHIMRNAWCSGSVTDRHMIIPNPIFDTSSQTSRPKGHCLFPQFTTCVPVTHDLHSPYLHTRQSTHTAAYIMQETIGILNYNINGHQTAEVTIIHTKAFIC